MELLKQHLGGWRGERRVEASPTYLKEVLREQGKTQQICATLSGSFSCSRHINYDIPVHSGLSVFQSELIYVTQFSIAVVTRSYSKIENFEEFLIIHDKRYFWSSKNGRGSCVQALKNFVLQMLMKWQGTGWLIHQCSICYELHQANGAS